MDIQSVPLQRTCMGCKRYFLLHEKLPLQGMTVQFKNYSFPIKQSFLKYNLVKTIVGFMNSKGGLILMGVDDDSGQVIGISLSRKQMDQFKLMVKQMLQKIQPAVDLYKNQQVSVEFIPVLEGKQRSFYGKYIIKFIVLQGDTSKLYCISEKIKIGTKSEEAQIISAFRRHALGGIQQIKGIRVIHQIYEKARNPHKVVKVFHQGCNPQPLPSTKIQRPKPEKMHKIFADEDSEHKSSSNSSKIAKSQVSQNETIIDKIQNIDLQCKQQNLFKMTPTQNENIVYFQNVKDGCMRSFINFLKNSTPAKFAIDIIQNNGIVKVKFSRKSYKQQLLDHLSKDRIKRIMNQFGRSNKIIISTTLKKNQYHKTQRRRSRSRQKTENFNYSLLFYGYVQNLQTSVQNYLKNCINRNLLRGIKKTKNGLQLLFQRKSDRNAYYETCQKSAHSRQLGQFWNHGQIKVKQFSNMENNGSVTPQRNQQKSQTKQVSQQKGQPILTNNIPPQSQNKQKYYQTNSTELIASSLEPSQVPKLSNYLVNNMYYKIQKKMFASKERYYIRLLFDNSDDCKEFMRYCNLQQHKNMLAQFSGSKTFRIGIPGDMLLITPYSDVVKEQLKKLIVKILGQGSIKKSVVKQVGEGQKVWALTLVDSSKLFEYYEKLEGYLRRQGFYINEDWVKFKVFLDYKIMSN